MDHVGQQVRVGGLIAAITPDGFDLDDGTALAHVVLEGDLAALLAHLQEGDAVAATGHVELVDGAATVVVDAQGSLLRVGALGQALPIGGLQAEPPPSGTGGAAALTADSTGLGTGVAPVSVLAMLLLSAFSVLVTLIRRRLVRRRLRTALVDRLASLRLRVGRAAPRSVS
jgi:hypothetical protein